MEGFSTSITVTVNEQVEVFPAPSVAVHVTVVTPTAKVEPEAGEQTTPGGGGQLSVAVVRYVTTALHKPASLFCEILAGHDIAGASASTTVTVKEQVAELPLASVAVHVTDVVPKAYVLPDAGEHATVTGQLSVAVAEYVTTALHCPGSLFCVMLAGQVMTGNSTSFTVTLNVQVAVLPDASVAVQVTVEVPVGKALPEAGLQLVVTPGQLSVADAVNETAAVHKPGSVLAVMFEGHVIAGASLSNTVTVNEQVAVLPALSVAVQVTVVTPTVKVLPEA
jgi:hypothetical protein